MAVGKGSILRATGAVKQEQTGKNESIIASSKENKFPGIYMETISIEACKPLPQEWEKIHKTDECSKEFLSSIETYGILEPVLVYQTGEKEYKILSGYKRFNAAKLLNLESVLAVVSTMENETSAKERYRELHKEQQEKAVLKALPQNKEKQVKSQENSAIPIYLL